MGEVMKSAIDRAAGMVCGSAYTVALTGAGISTPSGIPDFRSPYSGLWHGIDPLDVASIWAFRDHPAAFYRWIRPVIRSVLAAQPNPAHLALAEMEQHGLLRCIITQNVDSLHQRGGSRRILELHGHTRSATCLICQHRTDTGPLWRQIMDGAAPPVCPQCGGLLKPDVVFLGEQLPYAALSAAQQEALECEVLLIIGTSLEVMPAADLPLLARRRGARTILINQTPTTLDDTMDLVIRADVVRTMQALWRALRQAL